MTPIDRPIVVVRWPATEIATAGYLLSTTEDVARVQPVFGRALSVSTAHVEFLPDTTTTPFNPRTRTT